MEIRMLHSFGHLSPTLRLSATPRAQCLLPFTNTVGQTTPRTELTYFLVSQSSNLTNLSPSSPTLNPYSQECSPLPSLTHLSQSRCAPHSPTLTLTLTATSTSRRGRGPRDGFLMAERLHLVYDMGNAMLAWLMVRCLTSDGGMLIVSQSPLDRGPCTHLNSKGRH